MDAEQAYAAILRRLEAAGVPFTVHEHPPMRTVQDYVAGGFPLARMVKTVVLGIKGDGWALVAVRGADRVDYRKLADALGVKRSLLFQPPPEQVEAELGYQIGGVCPIPAAPALRVVCDPAIRDLARIYCGSGRNDRTLELTPGALLQAVAPDIAPVAL